MALATKCPQCGALFRVVADQLKLRGGLVRCGQCRTVFDAIGSLTYLDEGTLTQTKPGGPIVPTPAPVPARAPSTAPRTRAPRESKHQKALGPTTTLRITPGSAPVATISSLPPPPLPSSRPPSRRESEEAAFSEAGVPTLLAPDIDRGRDGPSGVPVEGIEVVEMPAAPDAPTVPAATLDEPSFIRSGRKTSRRGFSIVFGGGTAFLVLLALAQLAVIFRTELVSRAPQSRPVLAELCEVFGCSLGWPTQPDQLAVIGSELQALPGIDVLELTAVVRNRASFTQALPALEVTLTDSRNRPIARKVFSPVDYLAAAGEPRTRIDEGLAAGTDFTIRLFFEARGIQAAGFLVYPFYL